MRPLHPCSKCFSISSPTWPRQPLLPPCVIYCTRRQSHTLSGRTHHLKPGFSHIFQGFINNFFPCNGLDRSLPKPISLVGSPDATGWLDEWDRQSRAVSGRIRSGVVTYGTWLWRQYGRPLWRNRWLISEQKPRRDAWDAWIHTAEPRLSRCVSVLALAFACAPFLCLSRLLPCAKGFRSLCRVLSCPRCNRH